MRVQKKPCPCGCRKFMVPPIIGCQCGTLHRDEADELVRRWNMVEEIDALGLLDDPNTWHSDLEKIVFKYGGKP